MALLYERTDPDTTEGNQEGAMTATTALAALRIAGIKIFKIRAVVTEQKKDRWVDVYRCDEKVIVGDEQHARAVYKDRLNEIQTYAQYSKYSCLCELFEPHIFDNGELAYWPDDGIYLERFNK